MADTDIVIAWVNGADPEHQNKRLVHMRTGPATERVATKSRRFSDNEEVRFNLRSIKNHASWIRRIWLVTDGQFPTCIDRDLALKNDIHVVDHREIYRGFEEVLPVFNSLAIETMIWRIPGLADQFIYCNDDMMFAAPTLESDFFQNGRVVLRGGWKSLRPDEPMSFHNSNQVAAAEMFGYGPERFFGIPHVHYPMLRPVLERGFEEFMSDFRRNMACRFRERGQFWPISVHAYLALRERRAVIFDGRRDYKHMSVRFCKTAEPERIVERLEMIRQHRVKMTCVNYLEAVEAKVPDVHRYLSEGAGPEAAFELPRV